ncbi:MAG: hypothetical protein KKC84_03750, partial [Candidatus Omnitrophica bacterium]|nr:hypothetical protein [Candidatus Omnitrophota bacterium]
IVIGLEGLIKGNPANEGAVNSIKQQLRQSLRGVVDELRSENYILLPHASEFGRLVIPEGKKAIFVNEHLFDWQGAVSMAAVNAVVVPGMRVGGERGVPLIVAPFKDEALTNVSGFLRHWHTLTQAARIPLIKTGRFICLPSVLGLRLKELAEKRKSGLGALETLEFTMLAQLVKIIAADEVVTSYEVAQPKKGLEVEEISFTKVEGGIDAQAINKFLTTLPREKVEESRDLLGVSQRVFETALKMARLQSGSSASEQLRVLTDITILMAKAGRIDEALEIATNEISDPNYKSAALANIAILMAEAGRINEALEMASLEVTDQRRRSFVFAKLANLLMGPSRMKQSLELFNESVEKAQGLSDLSDRSEILKEIAKLMAEAGISDYALKIIRDQEPHPHKQNLAFVEMAEHLIEIGRVEESWSILDASLEIARKQVAPSFKAVDFAAIAKVLVKANRSQEALEIARKEIGFPNDKYSIFSEAAKSFAKAGKNAEAESAFEESLDVVRHQIRDTAFQSIALANVAVALAEVGKIEEALEIARSEIAPIRRSFCLEGIAKVLAEAGRIEEALAIARDEITDPAHQSAALAQIAKVLAKQGRSEEALEIARGEITQVTEKAQAFEDIALILAEAGRFDKALEIIEKNEISSKAVVVARIAKNLAEAARRKEEAPRNTLVGSLDIVRNEITALITKVKALGDIARALAAAGREKEAHTVIEEALDIVRFQTTTPLDKCKLTLEIIRASIDIGEIAYANKMLDQILDTAWKIKDRSIKSRVLAEMAEVLAGAGRHGRSLGEFDEALNLARTEMSELVVARDLVEIARRLAKAGGNDESRKVREEALAMARNAISTVVNDEDFLYLATVFAGLGMLDESLEIVRKQLSFDPVVKSNALMVMARSFILREPIDAARIDKALDIARLEITIPVSKSQTLAEIVKFLVKIGRSVEAEEIARNEIVTPHFKSQALAAIAISLGAAGRKDESQRVLDEALDIARNLIIDQNDKSEALAEIVKGLTEIGRIDGALDITRNEILDPHYKSLAFAAIVKAQAAVGFNDEREEDEIGVDEGKRAIVLWKEQVLTLRDNLISQIQAAYQPFFRSIPAEFKSGIEADLTAQVNNLFEAEEKQIQERFDEAMRENRQFDAKGLLFEEFAKRSGMVVPLFEEYRNTFTNRLATEPFSAQEQMWNNLYRSVFALCVDNKISLESLNEAALEAVACGWKVDTQERMASMIQIEGFIEALKASQEYISLADLHRIISFLSDFVSRNPQENLAIVQGQLDMILNASPQVRSEYLKKLAASFTDISPELLREYLKNPASAYKLGKAREFTVFLTNKVKQLDEKDEVVYAGEEEMPESNSGVAISQIAQLEDMRLRSPGATKKPVMEINELLGAIREDRMPQTSPDGEAKIIYDAKAQAESGAYAREIAQNSDDATIGKDGRLDVKFYLQRNRTEYVEEVTDNGTGALHEIALLIPLSTKEAAGQRGVGGFFGTGKFTIFEGVDRLELISKNAERAFQFTFVVERDSSGNPTSVKLTSIRRITDPDLAQGVTVRRIKSVENTIPELDRMIAERTWKVFAGLSQRQRSNGNGSFAIYMRDKNGESRQLEGKVGQGDEDSRVLSESDLRIRQPGKDQATDYGKFKIIQTKDMPNQIVDANGRRVKDLSEEYLALIPESLRMFIKERGIVIQIPLPLIRSRMGFAHENLAAIQKYIAVEFYKAIANLALTQSQVFEGLPIDWETNDNYRYWSEVMKDNRVVQLAEKINRGAYEQIAAEELESLLTEKGLIDNAGRFVPLILLLKVDIGQATPQSLYARRMFFQSERDSQRAKESAASLNRMGYSFDRSEVPRAQDIPFYQEKRNQARTIATAHEQLRHIDQYIIDPESYSQAEEELVKMATTMARLFGLEEVYLVSGDVSFMGGFTSVKGKRAFVINRIVAQAIGTSQGHNIDLATDTIVHELAHLLEESMHSDTWSEALKGGVVFTDVTKFTHQSVGVFAEAMKYVAAVILYNHSQNAAYSTDVLPAGESTQAPTGPVVLSQEEALAIVPEDGVTLIGDGRHLTRQQALQALEEGNLVAMRSEDGSLQWMTPLRGGAPLAGEIKIQREERSNVSPISVYALSREEATAIVPIEGITPMASDRKLSREEALQAIEEGKLIAMRAEDGSLQWITPIRRGAPIIGENLAVTTTQATIVPPRTALMAIFDESPPALWDEVEAMLKEGNKGSQSKINDFKRQFGNSAWHHMEVPAEILFEDNPILTRVDTEYAKFQEYAGMNTPAPPIMVVIEGDKYVIKDGFHRVVAARLRDNKMVDAYITIRPDYPIPDGPKPEEEVVVVQQTITEIQRDREARKPDVLEDRKTIPQVALWYSEGVEGDELIMTSEVHREIEEMGRLAEELFSAHARMDLNRVEQILLSIGSRFASWENHPTSPQLRIIARSLGEEALEPAYDLDM